MYRISRNIHCCNKLRLVLTKSDISMPFTGLESKSAADPHLMIAEGSFGRVFDSVDRNGASCVVKQLDIDSPSAKQRAEMEVATLSALSGLPNVPQFIEATRMGSKMCIAMSKKRGIPLNHHIQESTLDFEDRVAFSYDLLRTLCQTLHDISALCCHRDLNSHNILVEVNPMSHTLESACIVDFGLAIEKNSWWLYQWRTAPVGGDARYWPSCAWRMLLYGWRDVSQTPFGEEQYKDRLDMHSFALTLLEIVVGVHVENLNNSAVNNLHVKFRQYFIDATTFANVFVNCFQSKGDWYEARSTLKRLKAIDVTRTNLAFIKLALKDLREFHPLFAILERMICVNEKTVTGSWAYVLSKLNCQSLRAHY